MRVLGLDISTSTGLAVLTDGPIKIETYETITLEKSIQEFGPHPWGYYLAASTLASKIFNRVFDLKPDLIIIEETNGGGRARFTQKILEYAHYATLRELQPLDIPIKYINTRDWRKAVGSHLSKEDKKINAKISKLKKKCTLNGILDVKAFNKVKKELGVRGRVNKKAVTVRLVNSFFGTSFKQKDDDVCDAVSQVWAYFNGSPICDGLK